jgi:hypothetical protein
MKWPEDKYSNPPATRSDSSSNEPRVGGDQPEEGLSNSGLSQPAAAATMPARHAPGGIAGRLRALWNRGWFLGLLLVAATLVVYLPGVERKTGLR